MKEGDKKIEDFTRFFNDKNYLKLKNNLFNYLNRKRLIKLYSSKYLSQGRMADIGSGISPVSPCPKKTLFIDISKPALELLEKKGYKTLHGSITSLPIKNESLDFIFCSEVLEHIEDYKTALKEISRALSKRGIAFITVPCWQKYWNIDDEFVGHYRRFNPEELKKDIESSGLQVIKKKKIGSKLERALTLQSVKNFKRAAKINNFIVFPYILANHALSWAITLSAFLSTEENSNIILFICQKKD